MTGREKLMMAVCATIGLSTASAAMGQTISYTGATYTQDFDSLATGGTGTAGVTTNTWTDGSTINGWYAGLGNLAAGGSPTPAASNNYRGADGSSNSGQIYSFGLGGDSDRALGTIGSGTPVNLFFGAKLVNNTGAQLDTFTLTFTGEEWRQTTAAANVLSFWWSTSPTASAVNVYDQDTSYTAAPSLNFTAPTLGTDGPINGNLAANSKTITATIYMPNGWKNGETLVLRWKDINDAGNDQGLAIDNLSFSAQTLATSQNGTALSVGGSKTPAPVSLGRVVVGSDSATANVTLTNSGAAVSTPYIDASSDGSVLVPGSGTVPANGTASVGVKVSGSSYTTAAIGTDVVKTAVVKNIGNSNDANVQIATTAHVVANRFIDNYDPNQLGGGSAVPVDSVRVEPTSIFPKSTDLTTVNTNTGGDLSSNALTTLTLLAGTAPTANTANDAYASVTLGAGTSDTVYDDGADTTTRTVTLTALKSGLVKPNNAGGERAVSYLSVPIQVTDTAAGATGDARVYVSGDFYAPAAVVGDTTAVAPGGTVTLTNAPPSADSTSGKRLGADILGTSFNQSGWSVSGLPSTIGPARAQYTQSGTTFAAVISTATGTIAFSPAGKINGTYGATLSIALQNDQTQGVYGVAPNDLSATTVPLTATVSSNPAVQNGAYTLNGGTLSAPATTLTGSFTQSGGSSTFASVVGGGGVTVSGGSLVLSPGATTNVVGSLAISGTGKVDLTSAKLAVNYTGGTPANAIRLALLAGSASGWTGATGLTSSDAAAHTAASYAIGYAEASLVLGPTGGTWNGASVDGTTLLIKETYFGDANLDGKVDADDLVLLDRGRARNLAAGSARWTDGDFNYDGSVNAADYLLADTAYAQHGAPLSAEFLAAREAQFGEGYVQSLIAAVPEPTSLGLVGMAAAGLFGRRRRSAK